jgi:hypothetical protein
MRAAAPSHKPDCLNNAFDDFGDTASDAMADNFILPDGSRVFLAGFLIIYIVRKYVLFNLRSMWLLVKS